MRLRPPQSLVSWSISSPFVWCVGCVRLIWPEALSSHEDVAKSRGVIAHELAHLRRGDHWVAWLELVTGILWWWNPLYWLVRRRLRESAEMACDALAIGTCPERRREYAEMLLELSAGFETGMPAHVLAVSAGTPSSFERRLSMILSERVSGKIPWWGIVAALGLAAAALPGWSVADQSTDEPANAIKSNPEYLPDDVKGEEIPKEPLLSRVPLVNKLFVGELFASLDELPASDPETAKKSNDARQAIIKLIEEGKLNEAIAQLEALRAKEPRKRVVKAPPAGELDSAREAVIRARKRLELLNDRGEAAPEEAAVAKAQYEASVKQLEALTQQLGALLKVAKAESQVAQRNAEVQDIDAALKKLDSERILKDLNERIQYLNQRLKAADAEVESTTERTAAEALLREALRQRTAEQKAQPHPTKPTPAKALNATFPEKWKESLLKDLPEECLKKLPHDSQLSWKYCMSCHSGNDDRTQNLGIKLPAGEAGQDPFKAEPKTVRKRPSADVVDPGAAAELKGSARHYLLDRTGHLNALEPQSGKLYWKSALANGTWGRPGDRFVLQETEDGKLVLLLQIGKEQRSRTTFDAATGKLIEVEKQPGEAGSEDAKASPADSYRKQVSKDYDDLVKILVRENATKRRAAADKVDAEALKSSNDFVEYATSLTASGKTDAEVVQALYQSMLDRKPSEAESAFCLRYLAMTQDRKVALENIVFQLKFAKETQPKAEQQQR